MRLLASAVALVMLWYGCNGNGVGPSGETPVLSNPQISYDNRDGRFYAAVTVTLPDTGTVLDSIWAEMFLSSGALADSIGTDTLMAEVTLRDDATGGDILPSDGVYACKFPSTLSLGTIGTVRFEFFTLIQGELYSAIDSMEVNLSVLTQPQTSFDKQENQFFAAITVNVPSGGPALDALWTEMFLASGDLADSLGTDSAWAKVTLVDDGTSGDHRHSDNIYSREFDSPLPPGTIGAVRFEFIALVGSDLYFAADTLQLVNKPPVIVSVSSLDSVARPTSLTEISRDSLFVEVDDPDGLGDVKSVTFQIVKPDGTLGVGWDGSTTFCLFDDGDYDGERYFDHIPNDGIYSGGVSFGLSNDLGTYTLRFVATDLSEAHSETVEYPVVLY